MAVMVKKGVVNFSERAVAVNGICLQVLEAGNPEGVPVICLHGFPDTPHGFVHQYPALLDAGYRVLAPFMRGYPPSQSGGDVDYFPLRLAEDTVALIDTLCAGRALLLGHDWGAVASFAAAQLAPDKIEKMVVAAIPHGQAFKHAGFDLRQLWLSRYAVFFQLGLPANQAMRWRNMAGLDYLWSRWSPDWSYTEEDIQPLKACLGQPGAMESATAYYRAAVWGSRREKHFVDLMMAPTTVPTLVCAGANDACIAPRFFDAMDEGFSGEWRLEKIADAGHFMHRERPHQFNEAMLSFFAG